MFYPRRRRLRIPDRNLVKDKQRTPAGPFFRARARQMSGHWPMSAGDRLGRMQMQDRSVGIKRVQIKRAYGQLGKMTRQLERVPEGIRLPSVLLWLEDNAPLIREALRAGGEGFAKARRLPQRGERAQRLARGLMRFAPEEERIAESLRQDLEPDITEGELWMVPGLLLGLEALQAVEAAQAAMAMLEALEALRGENRRGLRSAWGQWSDRRRAAFVAAAYGIAGDGEPRR